MMVDNAAYKKISRSTIVVKESFKYKAVYSGSLDLVSHPRTFAGLTLWSPATSQGRVMGGIMPMHSQILEPIGVDMGQYSLQ